MIAIELYTIALERSTRLDLPIEHNEVPHCMARLLDTDRAACEGWLQEMNFLRLGEAEDDEVWERIKRNWIGYLSATSPTPDAALAPNRKVVQFRSGGEDEDEDEDAREQRRSLVGFIAYSQDEGTLEEMGMRLTESQIDDILDIEQEVWQVDLKVIARRREKGGFEGVWGRIQLLLMKALRKAKSTPRNNPLMWWIAVLARSAISENDGDRDFISRGRFHKNPMPMDVDLGERLRAIVHYSKVLVLDDAFSTWPEESGWMMEVQSRLNMVSIEWINDEGGSRPDGPPGDGGPVYSTDAWQSVVAHIAEHTKKYLGGKQRTAIYRLRMLANAMG
ncbi:uncharacterized protein NECHADRAFT_88405 [Fusarium vanettenii 77-13-4]|uniref:Uncharacterized protein n=1 Tax=Fusarium vanettenii (strain ATCC MYA-4622 / CBS 123669 / FGSC 9596 / NRRL 45880 / 77-13-4) TaxID=660122 RepID=C7ZMB9_FUSV7|nr:uncharacterized protein NECHADRAFT_88405 [Fusarium vanettenii 77-13-4]EEU34825.1 predicted protein [Fusarium vanettenii 77-13-4]